MTSHVHPEDELVFAKLRASRLDLRQSLRVEHCLYFTSSDAAAHAKGKLERCGFSVSVVPLPHNDPPEWEVRASRYQAVTEDEMAASRSCMERIAAEAGGDYDGWDARAVFGAPERPRQPGR